MSSVPFQAIPSGFGVSSFLALWLVYYVFLFGYLYRILTRSDLDVHHKTLWVLVVILAPVLGMALYLVAAPAAPLPASPPRPVPPRRDLPGAPWTPQPGPPKSS